MAQKNVNNINHSVKKILGVSSVIGMILLPMISGNSSAVPQDSVWVVTFTPGEYLESKLKKAAHVRPSPAQIKWMERGQNVFLHYGMNTFNGDDWGTGSENEKDFAPMQQDPDQWAKVFHDGKFSMVVPTVKHHDGFCLWNTATTNHSIKNATVKTDVFDALHKGCVNHNVDLGFYLSPWDRNQKLAGVWQTDAYNPFFINQLKELMTGYGPIGEVWFDGACGDEPTFRNLPWYRTKDWYDTIEALQPMSVIRLYDGFYYTGTENDSSEWMAIKQGSKKLQWRGKEIRWCGNEGGAGRADEWCVQPVFTRFWAWDVQNASLGQETFYNNAVAAVWYQSEVNTSIGEHWFWHSPGSQGYALKSLSSLKTLYYNSIGNDASLLLNLIVDNRGLIPDDQITLLKNWTNWIDSTFTKNYAKDASASATAEAPGHEADKITDNKRHTYWTTNGTWNIGSSTASITFDLKTPQTFDNVMIKEYVYDGQRVAGWNLEYMDGSNWKSLVTGKKVIGYKRICKFNQVTTSKVRLNITRSWDNPEISSFALYRTLSGIDLTPEDTTRPPVVVEPEEKKTSSQLLQPKVNVIANHLTIDAAGMHIDRIDLMRMDGRLSHVSESSGSNIISRTLTPGVYIVKIIADGKIFANKIAITVKGVNN
jgi:alpha-L-fucosidase